jgi:ribosomal protein L37AE/L43A
VRIRWAPKVPVALIVRLYRADAEGRYDEELVDGAGWRLLARCQDVLLVSDSRVACPSCGNRFDVPWIGQPHDRVATCTRCAWSITAGAYHASFEHRDLNGVGAREAFAEFVERYPRLRSFRAKMLAIDRLVNAVHTTGGVAARNLFEGRARQVLATLDAIARSRAPEELQDAVRRAHEATGDG